MFSNQPEVRASSSSHITMTQHHLRMVDQQFKVNIEKADLNAPRMVWATNHRLSVSSSYRQVISLLKSRNMPIASFNLERFDAEILETYSQGLQARLIFAAGVSLMLSSYTLYIWSCAALPWCLTCLIFFGWKLAVYAKIVSLCRIACIISCIINQSNYASHPFFYEQ